ncbi:MAG: cupin domain-containing protein [Lachnospiraceae bacterium]
MNEILFSNRELPRLRAAEYLVIASPFVHVDRIAPFHVLIYVTSGTIYVTEGGVPYDVQPGELLFLKSGVHHWGSGRFRREPHGTTSTSNCPPAANRLLTHLTAGRGRSERWRCPKN